jgi:hypothetical protein
MAFNHHFSTDVIDETEHDDTVAPVKYEITSFGADYDVEGLVKRLDRDDIYVPRFQRDYVWNQREASRFIESLLLGLPVPGVFLARDSESKRLLVIDGQQRLKTLHFFYTGFFNPKPHDKTKRVFRLINVQQQLEGRTYQSLEENDRIILNDTIIHATIVKQESPKNDDTSIYHIFERLNTSGRKLTAQQIRVAIYPGDFIALIQRLNEHPNWRRIYGRESAAIKDEELILRFLAMYFESDNYTRPMKEFLNKFAMKQRKATPAFLNECESLFTDTIGAIYESIGTKAFRPERALNAAVFDSVMVGLARRLKKHSKIDSKSLKNAYDKLLADETYINAISQSTSDDKNVEFRLGEVSKRFAEI